MAHDSKKKTKKRGRVLVVDNDKSFLFALSKFFKGSSLKIDTAHSIEKAIEQLELTDYDVLATDLNIDSNGNADGFGMIRIARGMHENIKTILFSDVTMHDSVVYEVRGEADPTPDILLEKPLSLIALEEAIVSFISP
ncbi:MAG: response regulator [Chitinispirillaceae bacterium]|nr:response regulator [Chitinispirillaceae bacterium]